MQDAQRIKVPPVMIIEVEDSMDVMLARNTARRAASLLGFNTSSRAQVAGAVASLVEIILNAGEQQVIHLHGLRQGAKTGLQVRCEAPWLASASPENASFPMIHPASNWFYGVLMSAKHAPIAH